MKELAGRTAVVTGGASGIGRGLCEALLAEGVRVVIADIEQSALDVAVKELGERGDVRGVVTNVIDFDSVDALAADVFATNGACHLLFNNAGVGSGGAGKAWLATPNDWKWCFGVNVFGIANAVMAFVPRMLASGEEGHIVNTSSGDGGFAPMPRASIYASTKAAVTCFTEALAHQLIAEEGSKLRASIFYPGGGMLKTGLWESERNRPSEFARERGLDKPGLKFDDFIAAIEKTGRSVEIMDLFKLGQYVIEGIKDERFIIGYGMEEVGELLQRRAASIGRCELPTSGFVDL